VNKAFLRLSLFMAISNGTNATKEKGKTIKMILIANNKPDKAASRIRYRCDITLRELGDFRLMKVDVTGNWSC